MFTSCKLINENIVLAITKATHIFNQNPWLVLAGQGLFFSYSQMYKNKGKRNTYHSSVGPHMIYESNQL